MASVTRLIAFLIASWSISATSLLAASPAASAASRRAIKASTVRFSDEALHFGQHPHSDTKVAGTGFFPQRTGDERIVTEQHSRKSFDCPRPDTSRSRLFRPCLDPSRAACFWNMDACCTFCFRFNPVPASKYGVVTLHVGDDGMIHGM